MKVPSQANGKMPFPKMCAKVKTNIEIKNSVQLTNDKVGNTGLFFFCYFKHFYTFLTHFRVRLAHFAAFIQLHFHRSYFYYLLIVFQWGSFFFIEPNAFRVVFLLLLLFGVAFMWLAIWERKVLFALLSAMGFIVRDSYSLFWSNQCSIKWFQRICSRSFRPILLLVLVLSHRLDSFFFHWFTFLDAAMKWKWWKFHRNVRLYSSFFHVVCCSRCCSFCEQDKRTMCDVIYCCYEWVMKKALIIRVTAFTWWMNALKSASQKKP